MNDDVTVDAKAVAGRRANSIRFSDYIPLVWRSVDLFRYTIRVTRNNFIVHNLLGAALSEEGNIKEAIDQFNKAIRLKPDYADVYNNRGSAYLLLGQREQGCRDAQESCAPGMCKLYQYVSDKGLCN